MNVCQIIYLSRATQHIDGQALRQIASSAAAKNATVEVTGALLYCDGFFLQILEGEGATLAALLETISADPRHADVQVVQRRINVPREFGDWAMECLHEQTMDATQKNRMRQCLEVVNNPDLVNHMGNDAHQLLVDMQEAIAAA